MSTYNVNKQYEGKPSKNKVEEKEVTLDRAIQVLDITERLWRKNGGVIVSRSENELVCEESDGSEVITWTIEENETWE
jgi:hypothetical protein